MKKGENNLCSLLKKRDKELHKRYEIIWDFAQKNYLNFMNIGNYTDHGKNHVINIEKRIMALLTKQSIEKLSAFDIFCLLVSCCLHDIGMMVKKESNETNLKIRLDHHKRVKELLNERHSEFQLNPQEARIIGEICYGHGITNLQELEMYDDWSIDPFGKINVLFLTALLRLGDLLDLTFLRAPELVADLKKIKGVSLSHWKLHNKVSDIKINHNEGEITIYATLDNEYELSELYKLRNWIRKELYLVREVISHNGIFLDNVTLKTNLDKKRVLSTENPFLRLESFDYKKHIAFFGRNKEVDELYKKISSNKLIILVGESGVGKTSLLNAGVKQRLIEEGYYVFTIRSTENFEKELFRNIKEHFQNFTAKDLQKLIKQISEDGFDIVIFFDQFEEIFTFSSESLKQNIVTFYHNILSDKKINVKSVLSIREDFLAEMWELSETENLPEFYDRAGTYRLQKLSRENAKLAIINSIEHIKYSIDSQLVEKLLNDFIQSDPSIYPPYLQIVCYAIFKKFKSRPKESGKETIINLSDYCNLRDAQTIIEGYFDEILDGFSFEEREVITELLASMITFFHTKQRVSYEKIKEINKSRIDIDKTLRILINHRIIRKIESERYDEFELIHDFLARKIIEMPNNVSISTKIKKATNYIEENFTKQIKLEELANLIDFSKEHFCRLFKKETGLKFVDYVNRKRIKEAERMLENPAIKISEIYRKVGFSSQQHFTKVFRDINSVSPSVYKRRISVAA